jgi:hypothetical protein
LSETNLRHLGPIWVSNPHRDIFAQLPSALDFSLFLVIGAIQHPLQFFERRRERLVARSTKEWLTKKPLWDIRDAEKRYRRRLNESLRGE